LLQDLTDKAKFVFGLATTLFAAIMLNNVRLDLTLEDVKPQLAAPRRP
jgi:hypothetical protein